MRRWPLVAVALAACALAPRRAQPAPRAALAPAPAPRTVYVSPHEDDDLLFMSPALLGRIAAGQWVRTVYVTAGDAGRPAAYWREREAGVRAAYARMAQAPDEWDDARLAVAGRTLHASVLRGHTEVGLVFLRLPDGGRGAGFAATGGRSLAELWDGGVDSLAPVDGGAAYDRAGLVATLAGVIATLRPTVVATLDPDTRGDHSDHHAVALFTLAAIAPHHAYDVRLFRGYDVAGAAPNLAAAAHATKWDAFLRYAAHDAALCGGGVACLPGSDYDRWSWRSYVGHDLPPAR